MTCVYVFGNGSLSFGDFCDLYAPAIERWLARPETTWAVCDFRGADALALEYLKARTPAVTVFHVGARPRYLPDRFGTEVGRWTVRGGFADDASRDAAAFEASTHFLAVDRTSTATRTSSTAKLIARARESGRSSIADASPQEQAIGRALVQLQQRGAPARTLAIAAQLLAALPAASDAEPMHVAVLGERSALRMVLARGEHAAPIAAIAIESADVRIVGCAPIASDAGDVLASYDPGAGEHRMHAAAALARVLAPR